MLGGAGAAMLHGCRISGGRNRARYAVVFRTGSKGPTAGALVVDDRRLMLVGGNVADPVEVSVAYTALVRFESAGAARSA